MFRPILQLISCLTRAAPAPPQTFLAHQAAVLHSLLSILILSVELEAAELLEALLALVLVVLARCVPSLCAARAHEVSVEVSMIPNHPCVPSACIKHLFASRAPVAVGCQALLPDINLFDTLLAS